MKAWTVLLLLIGWSPAAVAQIEVSLPDIEGDPGDNIVIAVDVSDLTGRNVTGFWFKLLFDPNVMVVTGVTLEGSITEGELVSPADAPAAGEFVVTGATEIGGPLSGSGALVYLTAHLGEPGFTVLQFDHFQFNDGIPESLLSNGSVRSGTPTSAEEGEQPGAAFRLQGHYPEPATDTVNIKVELGEPGQVQVRLFDMLGREVATTAFVTDAGAGLNLPVEVSDLPAGKYIYSITAGSFSANGMLTVSR